MKVLGIDTSSFINTLGIIDSDKILADFAYEVKVNSLEKIVLNIDFLLKIANLSLTDIQGFGVGVGPGSWTGVRVGLTIGKILAYVTGKPICGISTLAVLAYNAKNVCTLVCPILNAGKGVVYAAFYRVKNDAVTRVGEYYVGGIERLLKAVKEPTVFLGSGARSYQKLIMEKVRPLAVYLSPMEDIPRGSALALLAARRLEHGESDNALSLEPLYLKELAIQALLDKYQAYSEVKGERL